MANPFGAALRLLILGPTRIRTHALPSNGEVTIGSASSCHVVVAEPGVLPVHAVLVLGEGMSVRDAGSGANTMVGSALLSPGAECPLAPGVVLQLGGVAMLVQASGGSARLCDVRSHDYFEGRLESECARAAARGGSFAVMRLHFSRTQARAVEEAFARMLRDVDLVALHAADEYELLLSDTSRVLAEAVQRRICDFVASQGLGEPKSGLACWPRDGRSAEALLAAAGVAIPSSSRPTAVALAPTLPSMRAFVAPRPSPPPQEPAGAASRRAPSPGAYAYTPGGPEPEDHRLSDAERAERERILSALERCAGNRTQAARMLGLTRRALITRLERYALPRPRPRPAE